MEKIDNIEFYISCYFGVILSKICQVLRHFTWMSSNMADGNQQKHLLPSFATKAWIYSSRNS